jgi:putative ABC transport system ATP-binding protein
VVVWTQRNSYGGYDRVIEVKGVSKTYGDKHNRFMVLDNVSFSIPNGASVAIVGKSGSGKSSLVHAMSGLARPELGEVLIDGYDILTMSQKQVDLFRLTQMGFIFQSFFVQTHQTCYENVSLPLEILGVSIDKRGALIDEALRAVGLLDKKSVYARDLSGGQKQRLAVARAIVSRPKVLFADEPTGNLDSLTGDAIEQLLFWCNKHYHMTLIIVTHDHELADKCDMQVLIRDGKVARITDHGNEVPIPEAVSRKIIQTRVAKVAKSMGKRLVPIKVISRGPIGVPVKHLHHMESHV